MRLLACATLLLAASAAYAQDWKLCAKPSVALPAPLSTATGFANDQCHTWLFAVGDSIVLADESYTVRSSFQVPAELRARGCDKVGEIDYFADSIFAPVLCPSRNTTVVAQFSGNGTMLLASAEAPGLLSWAAVDYITHRVYAASTTAMHAFDARAGLALVATTPLPAAAPAIVGATMIAPGQLLAASADGEVLLLNATSAEAASLGVRVATGGAVAMANMWEQAGGEIGSVHVLGADGAMANWALC